MRLADAWDVFEGVFGGRIPPARAAARITPSADAPRTRAALQQAVDSDLGALMGIAATLYPATQEALALVPGGPTWRGLISRFRHAGCPTHPDVVRELAPLPAWLGSTPIGRERPWISDLARFEWIEQAVAAGYDDRWGVSDPVLARFRFDPCAWVEAPAADPPADPCFVLFWRAAGGGSVRVRVHEEEAAALLGPAPVPSPALRSLRDLGAPTPPHPVPVWSPR